VKLKGGLGNQLFQYAAGRRLACLHDVPLKLDLSWFGGDLAGATPRSYALGPFCIHAEPATDQEVARLTESQSGRVRRFINLMNPCYRKILIRGQIFHFDPSILRLPDNILLDGHWQSERYFSDIDSVIRSDFAMNVEPNGRNREALSVISGCNSVSVHFRRGDYVTDSRTAACHGTCADYYYIKAAELAAMRVDRPHFFVFSDDPVWVQEHFKISYPMTLVDHNGPDQAHEDLRLMSHCRHHIIANSSFSWWGAWLNPRPDKIVVAPLRWFNDKTIDTSDLMPVSWLRINP
jgi:hypothetical protein